MATLNLTAKICADKICALTTEDDPTEYDGPSALSIEEDGNTLNVEVPLIPLSHVPRNEMFVRTFIQPEEVIHPQLCRLDSTYLTWELLGHPTIGVYSDLGAYWIKIIAKNPSICGFEGSQIRGELVGVIKTYTPSTTEEEIPTDGSDSLAIDSTFDNSSDPQVQGDPLVVPGERISLWWKISKTGSYHEVARDYIHTCCLTGGWIVSVDGTYGKDDITYTVFIEDAVYPNIAPSDFKEYAVGDWVYILKYDSSSCQNCDRTAPCEGSDYQESDYGIIIPLDITGATP